jgi:hypothetical protein
LVSLLNETNPSVSIRSEKHFACVSLRIESERRTLIQIRDISNKGMSVSDALTTIEVPVDPAIKKSLEQQ